MNKPHCMRFLLIPVRLFMPCILDPQIAYSLVPWELLRKNLRLSTTWIGNLLVSLGRLYAKTTTSSQEEMKIIDKDWPNVEESWHWSCFNCCRGDDQTQLGPATLNLIYPCKHTAIVEIKILFAHIKRKTTLYSREANLFQESQQHVGWDGSFMSFIHHNYTNRTEKCGSIWEQRELAWNPPRQQSR